MNYNLIQAIAYFLVSISLNAQENLVLNPSIETTAYNQPKSWILIGSVDFYRNRSLLSTGIGSADEPEYPESVSGSNHLGIRSFEEGTEIAVARFSQPMMQDQWYRISCFAKTSTVDCACDLKRITVYPSDSILKTKYWYGAQPQIPFISLQPFEKETVISPQHWMEVFTYYKSQGGEQFLWVGDFKNYISLSKADTGSTQNDRFGLQCTSHFYCDSFKVERCLPPNQSRLTVHNITFNSGSHAITAVNDSNMLYLVKYLRDFPSIKLSIEGHTDNEGSEQFNLDLSQKRAAAVKNWLMEQGIEAARINTTGFGKSKPLGPQNTAEQKALNRRVEILLN